LKGINPHHAEKLLRCAVELAFVRNPRNYSRELRAHRLMQFGADCWSLWVDGSWRLVFRKDANGNVSDLDYCQYH